MVKYLRFFLVLFMSPVIAFASENCAEQFGGKCRDTCEANEYAAEGAFIDCQERQECCVEKIVKKGEESPGPKGLPSAKPGPEK